MKDLTIFGHIDDDLEQTVQLLKKNNVGVVIRDERELNCILISEAKERAVVTANAKYKGKGIATSSNKRTVPERERIKRMDKDHCIAEAKENPHIPLVDSIKNDILNLPSLSPRYCIYRVPIRIRERNPKAYTPQMVSIGPLHHGEKVLLGMEEFKLRCLKAFCDSTPIILDECLSMIKGKEEEVRNCYAERFDKLDSDSFVKMILLDCCFIIEVFLGIGRVFGKKYVSSDQLHVLERERTILIDPQSDLRVIPQVISDIILLENQLPFFIIEDLFNLAFHSNQDSRLPSFWQLSLIYIGTFFHLEDIAPNMLRTEVKHFVDLLRVCFLPSILRLVKCEKDLDDSTDMPQATEMQEAGMIMRASLSKDRLLDIQHTNGVLQVPKLIVDRKTEELFRNLVALEVCHYFPDTYIIDYLIFMDRLIDSAQDVELLIKRGVIYSLIDDSSAVATLFNNLCTGAICGHNYYYARECKEMSEYCNASWHKWKATLKRDYFSTPWRIASTAAAVILLVLTLIQTIKAF